MPATGKGRRKRGFTGTHCLPAQAGQHKSSKFDRYSKNKKTMKHRFVNLFVAIWILPIWLLTCNVAPRPNVNHGNQAISGSPYQEFDSALRKAYAQSDSNAKALEEAIKSANGKRVTIIFSQKKDTVRITPHPFGGPQ